MDQFAKLLATHRSLTEDTWSLLSQRGVDDSTLLVLDYRFESTSRSNTENLARALSEMSEVVEIVRAGNFFKPKWTITGSFRARSFNRESMVAWVEMMCLLGRQFECYFDGFGTSIPEQIPGLDEAA